MGFYPWDGLEYPDSEDERLYVRRDELEMQLDDLGTELNDLYQQQRTLIDEKISIEEEIDLRARVPRDQMDYLEN